MSQNKQSAAIGPRYKWVALSNTTLGVLMATINSNIVLIALPAIFNGIGINPLDPSQTNYLLWMLLGYMVITATLLVTMGRISDMLGRVRLYNLGFAIFTIASILLFLTPGRGDVAAMEMIIFRLIQAVGGSLLQANSTAILTDAFPTSQRGMALGINQVAAIVGSILGLILGGVLSAINWRFVFLVSVPFGIFGTVWAYMKLRELSQPNRQQKIDWLGNATFFVGLIVLMLGLTYGIMPYGNAATGWGNPFVLGAVALGVILLILFVFVELHVPDPMFRLTLFRVRAFSIGNICNFLSSLSRGGLQFMLIIWLQGVWLPLHGYSFADTPLWAGIYMLPMMFGMIVIGPISGTLADRVGSKVLATTGLFVQMAGFLLLTLLPANFDYVWFAVLLALMGLAQGLFSVPNTTALMNSVPPDQRGAASGMNATALNASSVISMTAFFTIVTLGLAAALPSALSVGLMQAGLAANVANQIAHLPPISALFAAFLGYNPMATLIPTAALHQLSAAAQANLLGKSFFPNLISAPFMVGLHAAFYISAFLCLVAAIASLMRGKTYVYGQAEPAKTAEVRREKPAFASATSFASSAPVGAAASAAPTMPVGAATPITPTPPIGADMPFGSGASFRSPVKPLLTLSSVSAPYPIPRRPHLEHVEENRYTPHPETCQRQKPDVKHAPQSTMNKQYTPAFKAKVVQELLKGEKNLVQIASEYGVPPTQVNHWTTMALEGLPGLFEKQDSIAELKAAHERELTELYAEIGRLTTQITSLKKKCQQQDTDLSL
jgi:EmrB/QacA subfamily drug resistance transporter